MVHYSGHRSSPKPRRRSRRGSAVVFFVMMMSVLATGMATLMALGSGILTQNADINRKRNSAFYAAEAGIQQAVWNASNNPVWISSLPVTATLANGATYTVSTVGAANFPTAPVTFQSVGASADGTVVSQASITVSSTVVIPGMSVGANLADSGTLNIAGGVQVAGNVTRSGTMTLTNVAGMPISALSAMGSFSSSGTFTVPGNVQFNQGILSSGTLNVTGNVQSGAAITHSGTWNVTGATLPFANPNVSVTPPTVNTAGLMTQAESNGTVLTGGTYSNLTIDFTKSPDGIVYINSNVTLSGTTTVKGTGTLIVQGTLSVSGSMGAVSSPAGINIVTTGNTVMSGTLYVNGCVCIGGSLTKSGAAAINGVVVVQSSVQGSGNISITYAAPPSFIQYGGGGGSGGNIQKSNFSGATY